MSSIISSNIRTNELCSSNQNKNELYTVEGEVKSFDNLDNLDRRSISIFDDLENLDGLCISDHKFDESINKNYWLANIAHNRRGLVKAGDLMTLVRETVIESIRRTLALLLHFFETENSRILS